jgi:antirestriction protein ArdC
MKQDDIYTRVTQQIIEAIEAGEATCRMPWHNAEAGISAPINAVSKRSYRGINVLALWAVAAKHGYPSGQWATYQQWKQLGAQVRKGEKSAEVVLWKTGEQPGEDNDELAPNRFLLARGYSVFNAAQVDGFTPKTPPEPSESERLATADAFFSRLPATIIHSGNEAYYDIPEDVIYLPEFKRFRNAAAYYSTLTHEFVHWSGASTRLNRTFGTRFGSLTYAAEELVAELGAAFLGAVLNTGSTPRKDHAGYVSSWLSLLKSDKRAIFTAASQAQKAVDWLCSQAVRQHAAA